MLILPHVAEVLAHWQVLLQNLLCYVLATVVLAGHGFCLDLRRGRRNRYRVGEGGEEQRTEAVASVVVFKARALGWYL